MLTPSPPPITAPAAWRLAAAGLTLAAMIVAAAPARAQIPADAAAQLQARLAQLERQIQSLTGLSFEQGNQIRRLRAQIADANLRLDALERARAAAAAAQAGPALGLGGAALAAGPSGQPADPNVLFDEARLRFQTGEFQQARGLFQQFIDSFPQDPRGGDVHYYLGELASIGQDLEEAQRQYALSVREFPQGDRAADALYRLGAVLQRQGRRHEACTAYAALERSYPEAPGPILEATELGLQELDC